jgi:tRNA (cmo5U34)-methyltransferase
LILVEKVIGAGHVLDQQMIDLYHKMKISAGYSPEEVERKRLSLQGVLVPLTARRNEELLSEAGFRDVDCFWRWMNFAGWVAMK